MLIKYRFLVDGIERNPIWADSLTKDYELESEQQFFRAKLEGQLIFTREDYDYLAAQSFNTKFDLTVQRWVNDTWEDYFTGDFTKTDCTWDEDNKKVEVKVTPKDEYTEVLAKMEYEFDLIKLAPRITPVSYLRRPILQSYLPGENVVGCFLGGMYWEQEVALPELDEPTLENNYFFTRGATFQQIIVTNIDSNFDLSDNYVQERDFDGSEFTEPLEAFGENEEYKIVEETAAVKATCSTTISETPNAAGNITVHYSGDPVEDFVEVAVTGGETDNQLNTKIKNAVNGSSIIGVTCSGSGSSLTFTAKTAGSSQNDQFVEFNPSSTGASFSPSQPIMGGGIDDGYRYDLVLVSSGQALFRSEAFANPRINGSYQLDAVSFPGSLTTGSLLADSAQLNFYTRFLTNGAFFGPTVTNPIPTEDLVAENRNYSRVASVGIDAFTIVNKSSTEPTEYGLRPDDKYYASPGINYFPSRRSQWDLTSIWFSFSAINFYDTFADSYTLKDAYKVSDVIPALLSEIDPTLTHEATTDYSEFLYAENNPINDVEFSLLITAKSNVLIGDYDYPAQQAPILLRDVLTMLRDCYKLYWFIEDGKFKIEHIKWFKNGGNYNTAPIVGLDLTALNNNRSNKPWAYQTSNWEYKKEELAERIEFSWMDDATFAFKGDPIEIESVYVQRGNVENINIPMFTSDIDYVLASPEDISRDGFVLFAATLQGSSYELPLVTLFSGGRILKMQNAYASFLWMQEEYWIWELPARSVRINGQLETAQGVIRNKKQTVTFPSFNEPVLFELIKTYIGNGEIEKLSINLSSRMCTADLRYDTDE